MPDGPIRRKRPERLRIRPVVLSVYPPGVQICRAYPERESKHCSGSHKHKPVHVMALSGWGWHSLCSVFGGLPDSLRPGGNVCVYELRVILIPGVPLLPYLGVVAAGAGWHSGRPYITVAVVVFVPVVFLAGNVGAAFLFCFFPRPVAGLACQFDRIIILSRQCLGGTRRSRLSWSHRKFSVNV